MPVVGYTAREIAALIPKSERNGNGYRAPCPAHRGDDLNLSIIDSPNGVVLKCFSHGCEIGEITNALGIKGKQHLNGRSDTVYYDYVSETGELLYQSVRYYKDGQKSFYQRRPDPANPGEFIRSVKGIPLVPYNLPGLIKAIQAGETILIVEGEKDVHTAKRLGFAATCNVGGAGKWRSEYSEALQGAHVVIIPDNDEPGRKHAKQVIRSLKGIAVSVKRVGLPGVPEKGDLTDWVEAGGTREELKALVEGDDEGQSDTPSCPLDEILQYDAKGRKVLENFYNMSLILENHEHWQGRIRFDAFRNRPMLDNNPVSDTTEFRISEWLGKHYEFGGNRRQVLSDAIKSVASKNEYDALLQWVDALPEWDHNERLERWMIDLCGAEDSDYSKWVGKVTILQMMNRALNPGCIARLVPIWNGPENQGKSTAVAILGGEWATTLKVSLESKEAHMAIHGYWVAELEELDTLYKSSESRLKAFLTNTSDHYVPKYANHSVDYPRRTVFIGTTNDSDYLRGLTGNTRFLPINTTKFNLDGLKAWRNQLFAEAKEWLLGHPGAAWWNEPDDLRVTIKEERDSRRVPNVYEDDLRQFLDGDGGFNCFEQTTKRSPKVPTTEHLEKTTMEDIFILYMKMESKDKWKDTALQRQVSDALKALGWYRKKSNSVNWWMRPDSDEDEPVPF